MLQHHKLIWLYFLWRVDLENFGLEWFIRLVAHLTLSYKESWFKFVFDELFFLLDFGEVLLPDKIVLKICSGLIECFLEELLPLLF